MINHNTDCDGGDLTVYDRLMIVTTNGDNHFDDADNNDTDDSSAIATTNLQQQQHGNIKQNHLSFQSVCCIED